MCNNEGKKSRARIEGKALLSDLHSVSDESGALNSFLEYL